MSLGAVLARAHRETVPLHVLEKIAEDDKAVVENVAMVLGAAVPTACVNRMDLQRLDGQYRLTVPLKQLGAGSDSLAAAGAPGSNTGSNAGSGSTACLVAFSELRQVASHAPSRIADVYVVVDRECPAIRIDVLDSETRMPYSQLEVVRVAKRTRWF